jgi:hypothetical protein
MLVQNAALCQSPTTEAMRVCDLELSCPCSLIASRFRQITEETIL